MTKITLIFLLLVIIAVASPFKAYCIDTTQNNIFEETTEQSELLSYDVKQFGSLTKSLNVIGNNEAILVVSNEQIIREPVIIPSNIILQFQGKGILNIGSTAKLLIKGPLYAERKQIFRGSGAVSFSGGILRQLRPEWWGAKQDGISDDTRPVQATINSLPIGGGEVLFEEGTYVVNSISLPSNVSIVGSGRECVLEQKKNSKYCCSINPGNGGTPDPKDNKKNIVIRNIHFRGTVAFDGFSEHVYLLNINAATDVAISDCWFSGWRGDAIYLGSSNFAHTERHNMNIVIKNCDFDGVNNENRNAISVIDCDGLEIYNNTFNRCTRQNMPGAIDMEPDANRFAVIRNINVSRNRFSQVGGNVGIISLVLPLRQKELLNPSRNIVIQNNAIDGLIGTGRSKGLNITQNQNADDADGSNEITIAYNDIKNTSRPFVLWGVKGVSIENNIFADSLFAALVSYSNGNNPRDVTFKDNVFSNLGSSDGHGVTVFDAENISFSQNTFENVTHTKNKHGSAIDLSRYFGNKILIENNNFKGGGSANAVIISRNRHDDAELSNYITQYNSFDPGIKPVSLQ